MLSNLYQFRTRSEASALVGSECSAQQAALALGPHADMVVVTDGADGSCISALGSLQVRCAAALKHVELCHAAELCVLLCTLSQLAAHLQPTASLERMPSRGHSKKITA